MRLASLCSCARVEVCRKFSAVAVGPVLPGQALPICQCESELASNPSLDNPVLFLHTKAMFLIHQPEISGTEPSPFPCQPRADVMGPWVVCGTVF